jgi:hypothetical protein
MAVHFVEDMSERGAFEMDIAVQKRLPIQNEPCWPEARLAGRKLVSRMDEALTTSWISQQKMFEYSKETVGDENGIRSRLSVKRHLKFQ